MPIIISQEWVLTCFGHIFDTSSLPSSIARESSIGQGECLEGVNAIGQGNESAETPNDHQGKPGSKHISTNPNSLLRKRKNWSQPFSTAVGASWSSTDWKIWKMRGCIDWMMRGDDLDPSMAPLPSDMELGNWLVAPELGIVTWWLIICCLYL